MYYKLIINHHYQKILSAKNRSLCLLQGFSLLETLIVLFIISILIIISYPSYHAHFVVSRRNEAKIGLFELASKLESFKSLNNSYQNATLDEIGMPSETEDHSYQFLIKNLGDTSYTIEAVPEISQANSDPLCETLGLDETGNKTLTGSGTVEECW
jgi:type IV pilus assembly protein PilE